MSHPDLKGLKKNFTTKKIDQRKDLAIRPVSEENFGGIIFLLLLYTFKANMLFLESVFNDLRRQSCVIKPKKLIFGQHSQEFFKVSSSQSEVIHHVNKFLNCFYSLRKHTQMFKLEL